MFFYVELVIKSKLYSLTKSITWYIIFNFYAVNFYIDLFFSAIFYVEMKPSFYYISFSNFQPLNAQGSGFITSLGAAVQIQTQLSTSTTWKNSTRSGFVFQHMPASGAISQIVVPQDKPRGERNDPSARWIMRARLPSERRDASEAEKRRQLASPGGSRSAFCKTKVTRWTSNDCRRGNQFSPWIRNGKNTITLGRGIGRLGKQHSKSN